MPDVSIERSKLTKIRQLRALFLQEINAQVRYDAAHARTGTTQYLIRHRGREIGYGAVKDIHQGRGTVFEFYLIPVFRSEALAILQGLIDASGAGALECQSNDRFYAELVGHFPGEATCDTILFAAGPSNGLQASDAVVRRRHRKDRVFEHHAEPVGDFVVDVNGDVVGTGGFLLHYNPPFADLYMEVRADARRRGYGSFLIQELIGECYLAGRVPAARTGVDNVASQRTLLKGGLRECGRMLRTSIK
jgi:GNAT superfamily N-acetyltransferase